MNIVSRRSRAEPSANLSDLLALYVSRLVRQHLVAQYVERDHQVFTDGHLLVQQTACRIKAHMSATTPPWHLRGRIGRMVLTTHIRELALQRAPSASVSGVPVLG